MSNSEREGTNVPVDLFHLFRQYSAATPVFQIKLPSHLVTQATQNFLVHHALDNPRSQAFQPALQYRQCFWRWIVRNLESTPDIEIDAALYIALTEQQNDSQSASDLIGLGLTAPRPPSPSYVTYYWHRNPEHAAKYSQVCPTDYLTATLLESRTVIESGTTGLRTWLAAFHLAHYLILHPGHVKNKRVLELGSGTGFLGIIVGSLQMMNDTSESSSSMLFLTDANTEVAGRCSSNVKLSCNMTATSELITCTTLDWLDALSADVTGFGRRLQSEIDCDVVLGADIVFEPSLIPPLVKTLYIALDPRQRPRYALIALNVRNRDTYDLFITLAGEAGLMIDELDIPRMGNTFLDVANWSVDQVDGVRLLRITSSHECLVR